MFSSVRALAQTAAGAAWFHPALARIFTARGGRGGLAAMTKRT